LEGLGSVERVYGVANRASVNLPEAVRDSPIWATCVLVAAIENVRCWACHPLKEQWTQTETLAVFVAFFSK
jgi:hypothetical protein